LLGNTKDELYKINSVSENNYENDENPLLICNEKIRE
jgi:hypothetical protein